MRIFTILFLFISHIAFAQSDQEVGTWRSYLPYNLGLDVTESPNQIIYATPYAIMTIEKSDFSINYLSKVEGLSDVGIKAIEYDLYNDQLIVVYNNSNIDIIRGNEIINIPTIKDNRSVIGSKGINHIFIYGQNSIFFATDFGLVELDGENVSFRNTLFTDFPVNAATAVDARIYMATDDGVYNIDYENDINIADFNQWSSVSTDGSGIPQKVDHIAGYNQVLYISDGKKLWKIDGELISTISFEESPSIQFVKNSGKNLLVGYRLSGNRSNILKIDAQNTSSIGGAGCINYIVDAIEDMDGSYWYADLWRGFRHSTGFNDGCDIINNNTPQGNTASDFEFRNGVTYIATGGYEENYRPLANRDGIYLLEDNRWKILNEGTVSVINEEQIINIDQIELHPTENTIYMASYANGLLEYSFDDESYQYFSTENSGLQHAGDETEGERLSGLTMDDDGNLWINNIYAYRPIVVYTKDGDWFNFPVPGSNGIAQITIDEEGLLWNVIVNSGGGVLVYDHNNTINDPTDDRSKILDKNNSEIPSDLINCIAVDLDGDVWVGTSQGPVIFNGGTAIFDQENPGNRLKTTQDGIPAILLATEDVRSIAIDGANRKWIGTRNGIFVMNAVGDEQVEHYTIENSPLFSNNIVALAYHGETGVMYISTEQGLQTIRTASTSAKLRHSSNVYAYPNPVRPGYNGDIYIKGLGRDANVKITDMNGRLVYETTALGGQAVWDGNDIDGRRAKPGVYLVFSSSRVNFETHDSYVTKIMIVE